MAMVEFSVENPIKLDLVSFSKALENEGIAKWKKEFWRSVEDVEEGLPTGIGVYVICIQHGKSIKPWYVGKTHAKSGFKVEVFTDHKLKHYSSLTGKNGSGLALFMPLRTTTGKLSSNTTSAKDAILWLEKLVISHSLKRNAELLNSKDTKHLSSVFVPGLVGVQPIGRPKADGKLARAIFLGEKL